jgi:phosphatidylglycerol:prolipoprotein diacylglycerol transferase
MRQTLLRIPLDGPWSLGPLGEVPGFGFGVVLLCWVLFGIAWVFFHRRELKSAAALAAPVITWGLLAAAIVALPRIVQRPAEAALAAANRALLANPRSVEALLERSRAHFLKREYALAVEDLQTALQIDPQQAAAWERLAWIEATCPNASIRNGAQALKLAKKACSLASPETSEYAATLAAAYAEDGDFSQAAEIQRKALRLVSKTDDASLMALPRMREQLQGYEKDRPFRDESATKSVPVFGFGAMLFIGFVAGAWTAGRRGATIGYPPQLLWDVGIALFIAGVVGCRMFYCIQYGNRVFYNVENHHAVLKSLPDLIISAINLPDGGLVYYGGLVTGGLAAAWICRQRKLNLLELGDIAIPSLFLGMAFGRIGCFLNGCCYGDRCDLPWGAHFPMGSVPDMALVLRGYVGFDQDLSMRLHPTQLYSSLDGFFLALLTHAYFRYRPCNGAVVALGALTYPITRFAIESLRGDEMGQFNTSLTISQWFSVGLFAVGVAFTAWLATRPNVSMLQRRAIAQI